MRIRSFTSVSKGRCGPWALLTASVRHRVPCAPLPARRGARRPFRGHPSLALVQFSGRTWVMLEPWLVLPFGGASRRVGCVRGGLEFASGRVCAGECGVPSAWGKEV